MRVNTGMKMGLVTGLAFLAAGCTQILPIGSKAERSFSLRYELAQDQYHGSGMKAGPVIFLDDPLLAEGLGGRTITVELEGRERTALKGAKWSAPLSDLIRGYLNRNLMANTQAQIVGEGGLDVHASCRISSKVWSFELHPQGEDGHEEDRVHVSLDLSLIDMRSGDLIGRNQFDNWSQLDATDGRAVVAAFHEAMEPVATDIAAWVTDNLKECSGG